MAAKQVSDIEVTMTYQEQRRPDTEQGRMLPSKHNLLDRNRKPSEVDHVMRIDDNVRMLIH